MDRKTELLAAAAPWVFALLAFAIAAILIMVGHDMGAQNERSVIGNECRQAGKFTVKRTGFECGVIK